MFDIFKDTNELELINIYKDILQSEEDGISPRSLDKYARQVQEICKYDMFSKATDFTKELFYKEVAKRYFVNR